MAISLTSSIEHTLSLYASAFEKMYDKRAFVHVYAGCGLSYLPDAYDDLSLKIRDYHELFNNQLVVGCMAEGEGVESSEFSIE